MEENVKNLPLNWLFICLLFHSLVIVRHINTTKNVNCLAKCMSCWRWLTWNVSSIISSQIIDATKCCCNTIWFAVQSLPLILKTGKTKSKIFNLINVQNTRTMFMAHDFPSTLKQNYPFKAIEHSWHKSLNAV